MRKNVRSGKSEVRHGPYGRTRPSAPPASAAIIALGFLACIMGVLAFMTPRASSAEAAELIRCNHPTIVDGDTMRCDGVRIRLAHIDAPEMPGHCRPGRRCTPGDPDAAKSRLEAMTRGSVICRSIDTDAYGRTVALCSSRGTDLSCAMVRSGLAVERYGRLSC